MKNKLSPCCKDTIIKRKRFGGQVLLEYCKKCNRRVWEGNKSVTREKAYQLNGAIMQRLYVKKTRGKTNKLADAFNVPGVEFLDALDYLSAMNQVKNKKK